MSLIYIFFFKQKTAYEMRISDWSSDVCSSDLAADALTGLEPVRPEIDGVEGPFYLVVGTLAVHKNLLAPVQAVVESGRKVIVVGASGNSQVFSAASDRKTDG